MKNLLLTLTFFLGYLAPTQAQYVTIPDPNFVTKLQMLFPNCMNGNQMDTTCTEIVNATQLNVSSFNISNLSGVEYFDNLNNLNCYNNQLTSLPTLPDSLTSLNCTNNQLTSLPTLPNSLTYLECNYNPLASLPPLPNSLLYLYCEDNQLASLPTLPNSLTTLYCTNNQLTSLPTLPNSLTALSCSNNQLTTLPTLPNSLTTYLGCIMNQLTSLPTLPNSLTNLECRVNQLTSLPALPDSLIQLNCSDNQLTTLPLLPSPLIYLYCNNNQLTTLPTLPNSLIYLYCNDNQLTSLPSLPNTLGTLWCNNNQLTSLPEVPVVMSRFLIQNNNISCLVNLPALTNSIFGNISNNPLTCVPNQTNYSMGLPLCMDNDSVNNPNQCQSVANVSGTVYSNLDANCALNASDARTENIPVKLYNTQNNLVAFSNTVNGVYSFANLPADSFFVRIHDEVLPIQVSCGQPNVQAVHLNSTSQSLVNLNFPVDCDTTFDAFLQSVVPSGWVFPGQVHSLSTHITGDAILYNLACDSSLYSGSVSIQVNGPVAYSGSVSGSLSPTVSGNTFTYTIANFNTLTPASFGLQFLTDTTAQAGDQVCVTVHITTNPTDADTTNNHYSFCYNVVNSYDPNMKEVHPVNVAPGYNDWFTYTIHFQNTGNAPAFNIRLKDTLDTHLDLNSFEVMGYSHPARVSINGRVMTVRFNNIMLPDSTSNLQGSMGYFQYRLKPNANLPLGTQIENTAYIYFDYNAPIITNTTQNTYEVLTGVSSKGALQEIGIFPNPGKGLYWFKDAALVRTAEVFDVLGQRILQATNPRHLDLSAYPAGIYLARINGTQVVKLVKE